MMRWGLSDSWWITSGWLINTRWCLGKLGAGARHIYRLWWNEHERFPLFVRVRLRNCAYVHETYSWPYIVSFKKIHIKWHAVCITEICGQSSGEPGKTKIPNWISLWGCSRFTNLRRHGWTSSKNMERCWVRLLFTWSWRSSSQVCLHLSWGCRTSHVIRS